MAKKPILANIETHSTFFVYWEMAYESKEYATPEEAREALNGIIEEAGEDLKLAQIIRKHPPENTRFN